MFEGSRTMAKKFGKFLLATALIGTAAAGTYYYLKKKKEEESFDFDTENGEDAEQTARNYVPLNFEKAGEKVNIFVSKAGDVLGKTVDMVKQKVGSANNEVADDYLDDDDDDLDIEPLDLDDEPIETPVEVVEDIIADDTEA